MQQDLPFIEEQLDSDAPEGHHQRYNFWSVTRSKNPQADRIRGTVYAEIAAVELQEAVSGLDDHDLSSSPNLGRLFVEVFFAMAENSNGGIGPIEAGFIGRAARYAIQSRPFDGLS